MSILLCVFQVVKLKKKCKGKHSTDSTYSHRYTSVLIFGTDALPLKNLHSPQSSGHAFLQLYRSMAALLISFGHGFLEFVDRTHDKMQLAQSEIEGLPFYHLKEHRVASYR